MVTYKCFTCGKQIAHKSLEKRFLCPKCGGRIFFKPRERAMKIKAV
jgi:DNA-directed RNA polymerase subunit RPC12/RpoP